MAAQFRITGIREVEAALKKVQKEYPKKAFHGLVVSCENIMRKSKEGLVPVAEHEGGNLRDTGVVLPDQKMLSVTLAYGGPAAPYATAVHENPSDADPPTWRGKTIVFHPSGHGQKFLEKPVLEALPRLPQEVAREAKL